MKNIVYVLFLAMLGLAGMKYLPRFEEGGKVHPGKKLSKKTLDIKNGFRNPRLLEVFNKRVSGVVASGKGVVVKLLPDDNKGIRHQRFIIRVSSSQTILMAHNIDLAERVPRLSVGDTVGFKGRYEWNSKGGVIHWTHHDPHSRRSGGWIKLRGRKYQ